MGKLNLSSRSSLSRLGETMLQRRGELFLKSRQLCLYSPYERLDLIKPELFGLKEWKSDGTDGTKGRRGKIGDIEDWTS